MRLKEFRKITTSLGYIASGYTQNIDSVGNYVTCDFVARKEGASYIRYAPRREEFTVAKAEMKCVKGNKTEFSVTLGRSEKQIVKNWDEAYSVIVNYLKEITKKV